MTKEDTTSNEPISLNLEQDTYDALIEAYVNDHFTKESIKTFNDYLAAGESHIEALSCGVVNEMVIIALTDRMSLEAFTETLKGNDNKE